MNEAAPVAAEGQAEPAPEPQGQGEPQAWFDVEGVTDEQKGYIQNKGWQDDPLKVIDAYQNLEKFQGVPADQLLKLPKDMEEVGALDEIYTRLGRPEEPGGYGEFELPEGTPEGFSLDKGRMEWADGLAHKLGLNKAQRDALVGETINFEGQAMAEFQKSIEVEQSAQLEALKGEWGAAFDERSDLGKKAVRALMPEGADKEQVLNAIESAVGTAMMLKIFANAGEHMGEDKVHDSSDGVRPYGFSPEQAKAEKAQLMDELKDPTNKDRLKAFNDGKGVDYKRIEQLNNIIFGVA